MKLIDALELKRGDVVSLIGSGGKTSSLVAMMHECQARGWRVLMTTTTRIGVSELSHFPTHTHSGAVASCRESSSVFVYNHHDSSKVYGLDETELITAITDFQPDLVLIEADGSRKKSLKIPYSHEPVVPTITTKVVAIVGLSVLGKPCIELNVYNPDAIVATNTLAPDGRVRAKTFVSILANEIWGQTPPHITRYALINQVVPNTYYRGVARFIARYTLQHNRQLRQVLIGSSFDDDPVYEVVKPISAVILAAGRSTRMGQSKILMPWRDGQTLIEQIITQLQRALVAEVVVVTGRQAEEVASLAERHGARSVFNPAYHEHDMLSSLKVGLNALDRSSQACLICLGDQPRIQQSTIRQVLNAYSRSDSPIVAPSYQMRRGHPLLVDRSLWEHFLQSPDDAAPRVIVERFASDIHYVLVDTDTILRDVDTLDDYQNERQRAGLGG